MTEYHSSLASSPTTPTQNTTSITASFLGSPRIFNGFLANRSLSDSETAISPTSILDTKTLPNFVNPFGYDKKILFTSHVSSLQNNTTNRHTFFEKGDGVGLALVDSLNDEKNDANLAKPNSKMVLFGAKLKVQIPPLPPSALSPVSTPKSPAEFGIKTRNSLLLGACIRGKDSPVLESAEKGVSLSLTLSEMELSEEYTCVITHGPNPKTTHIFDDCVVENCCGVVKLSDLGKDSGFSDDDYSSTSLPMNFSRVCYSCRDNLGDGKDIFMYRGEKAFCSLECRCQEMLLDEGKKNL